MAVPKRRTTRSKRNMRRANHDKVVAPNVVACPKCSEPTLSHRVCAKCGYYKDRQVIEVRDAANSAKDS